MAEEEAWRLELENALRSAKGEPLLKSLDDLEAEDDPAAPEEDVDAADDPWLAEAGEVLVDLIGFGRQVAMLEPGAAQGPTARDIPAPAAVGVSD